MHSRSGEHLKTGMTRRKFGTRFGLKKKRRKNARKTFKIVR